ncbi:mak16-a [Symbiodinium sp. CCMP2456]|nr:mak16-a [Symbiodinium sp. CCMP2456]
MPAQRRHHTFESVEAWLETWGHDTYGKVWLPKEEVVLGEEAEVLEALHNRPSELRFFQRSAVRRPIVEIAGFIAHKLSRSGLAATAADGLEHVPDALKVAKSSRENKQTYKFLFERLVHGAQQFAKLDLVTMCHQHYADLHAGENLAMKQLLRVLTGWQTGLM